MRISLCLLALFFVSISCKNTEKILPTSSVKDSIPNERPRQKVEPQRTKEVTFNINLDTLKQIDLPIGSELLVSHKFPKKFGLEGDAYLDFFDGKRENDSDSKLLYKVIEQNGSYRISDSIAKQHLNTTFRYNYFYRRVRKDTTYNKRNIKVIGKIIYNENQFILCSLIHFQLPTYSSIFLFSVDSNNNVKDVLVLFDEQVDYLSQTNELFYINENFIITKKYFDGFEGVTDYEGEEFFTINAEGIFIRHYKTNGNYKSDKEEGLVKNKTREGLWIEKKDLVIPIPGYEYCFVAANYEKGLAVGTWKYYELVYDTDSNGAPIFKTATKGPLLYTETYENGKMVKREFVNDKNNY